MPNTAKIENLKADKLVTGTYSNDAAHTVIDGGKIKKDVVEIPSVWLEHHPDGFHSEDPMVDHPSHYSGGTLDCIEWIESRLSREEYQGYLIGNVLKYLWRYPEKGGIQDVEKAMWYLDELRCALRAWQLQAEAEAKEIWPHTQDIGWSACEWECRVSGDELDRLRAWMGSEQASSDFYSSEWMEKLVERPIFLKASRGLRKAFWPLEEIRDVLKNPREDYRELDPYILYFPTPHRVEAMA